MDTLITYFGQTARVVCDERCEKAWGRDDRPRLQHDAEDPDDYSFLADHELGTAPADPGTTEGDDRKPVNNEGIPNRWCVRQCERCAMSMPGKYLEPLAPVDFSIRQRNKPVKAWACPP
jgi:hypothetical protein